VKVKVTQDVWLAHISVQSSFDLDVTSKRRESVKMTSLRCRAANVDLSLPVTMVMTLVMVTVRAVTARKFKVSMTTVLPTKRAENLFTCILPTKQIYYKPHVIVGAGVMRLQV
jgi:hypothetical protein